MLPAHGAGAGVLDWLQEHGCNAMGVMPLAPVGRREITWQEACAREPADELDSAIARLQAVRRRIGTSGGTLAACVAGPGREGVTLSLDVAGSTVMSDDDIRKLTDKIGRTLRRKLGPDDDGCAPVPVA